MKIGFLGAGRMGLAIAGRILGGGHEVRAWNRTRGKLDELARKGATVVGSPRDAADEADVVVSMLADDAAVIGAVLEGGDAALAGMKRGAIHVSMSTISPSLAARASKRHADNGHAYVAAPVLGRPEAAEKGQLVILAAGPAEAVERCAPLFEVAGKETHKLGTDPTKANAVKLGANLFLATMLEAIGESYALVERHGVEAERFLGVVNTSLFKSPVLGAYGEKIAKGEFEPAGFALRLGMKDVRLALEAGESKSLPLPLASSLRDRFLDAVDRGMGELDWSAVARAGRT